MRRMLIVTLVCVNAALLLALVLGAKTPPANAQVVGGGADYLAVTGRIGSTNDAIYMIDLGQRKLAAFRYDPNTKDLQQYRGRDLVKDFGRKRDRR